MKETDNRYYEIESTGSTRKYRLVRNTAIAVVVVLVILLTGSYGYEARGKYVTELGALEFHKLGGLLSQ